MRSMTSKLPINLEDLLRRRTVEDERIEYKKGWNPDAIIQTLCAFANDFENLGGGYIVIGQDCDDMGQPIFPPVGLRDNQLDKIQQELLSYGNLIQPPYFPILSVERLQERNLITRPPRLSQLRRRSTAITFAATPARSRHEETMSGS